MKKMVKECFIKDLVNAGNEICECAKKNFVVSPSDNLQKLGPSKKAKRYFDQTYDGKLLLVEEESKQQNEHEYIGLALDDRRLALE